MKNILRKEGGFTLIELLVVILIIAILIAVSARASWARRARPTSRRHCRTWQSPTRT
jgi:prepilin-type N-terminal cleavage/methylation domain-containing protein